MSPIERSNPRVMAGKATLTALSNCTAPVPRPITATCQELFFKWVANVGSSSCLKSNAHRNVTLVSSAHQPKITDRLGVVRVHGRQKEFRDSGGLAKSGGL